MVILYGTITDQLYVYLHKDVFLKPLDGKVDANHGLLYQVDEQFPQYIQVEGTEIQKDRNIDFQLQVTTHFMELISKVYTMLDHSPFQPN